MSAETLRRAAALMRERAEAATPGPWSLDEIGIIHNSTVSLGGFYPDENAPYQCGDDNLYIASWHPAVALAVADWLEDAADDFHDLGAFETCTSFGSGALAVARAYLGESQ